MLEASHFPILRDNTLSHTSVNIKSGQISSRHRKYCILLHHTVNGEFFISLNRIIETKVMVISTNLYYFTGKLFPFQSIASFKICFRAVSPSL